MKDVIFSALMMALCYAVYSWGLMWHIDTWRLMTGALALMGASFTAGYIIAGERFRHMLEDLLTSFAEERDEGR